MGSNPTVRTMNPWKKSSFSGTNGCVEINWRKSSYSTGGNCVEISEGMRIRNSQHPERGTLSLNSTAMAHWIAGIKRGEFDDLA